MPIRILPDTEKKKARGRGPDAGQRYKSLRKRTVSSSKTRAFRKAKDRKEDLRFMKIVHDKKFGDRPKLKKHPQSTVTGYFASQQRKTNKAIGQKYNPYNPKSAKNPGGYKGTHYRGSIDKRLGAKSGGRIGLKSGKSPKHGKSPGWPKQPLPPKWRDIDKYKDLGKGRKIPEGIFGLGEKGKPHSTKEGKEATMKLARERLRSKKGVGGILKKVITKIKPKPKPKPGAVKDVNVDKLLKNLGDEIRAAPLPPQLKKSLVKLQKAYPHKKASGGRIGLQYGSRPRPQGPHTWVKSGGAVLKGKKVGIQIK